MNTLTRKERLSSYKLLKVAGSLPYLRYEPTKVTTNRKPCQREPNQVADWELRIGAYRVYYAVDEAVEVIGIERIGEKPNHTVFFRGKRWGAP